MATRLIQVVAFTNVAAGAEATLAHSLNENGTAVLPDWISKDNPSFVVVGATSSTVTVQNLGGSTASCNVWLQRVHTVPRALGGAIANLTPQPFIPADAQGSSATPARLTTEYYTPSTSRVVRYLRPGGDNANDGLTPATAWAGDASGLIQALEWLSVASYNQIQVIDITGCSINVPTQLNLGGVNAGTTDRTFDFAGSSAAGDYSRAICQIVAEAELVLPVTVTGNSADPTSGICTITVSETLVVNAHRGQFLVEEGFGFVGTIRSNTANTITVCTITNPQTWNNPTIYTTGATLTTGDGADPFTSATYLQAYCDWFFSGIHFASNGGKAVALTTTGPGPFVSMALCQFDGIDLGGVGGSQYVSMDACFINANTWGINGASFIVRNSYARGVQCIFHSSGQYADINESVVELHTQPFGGGVSNPTFQYVAVNSEFRSGTAGGVRVAYGSSRLQNCVVAGNTGVGVAVGPNAFATLTNVDGTGNTTYGISITNGSQVDVDAATSVTGTTGDILLGGAGTTAYGAVPANDLGSGTPQLVRIF